MHVIRYPISNTSENTHVLCELIRDPSCVQVLLYASVIDETDTDVRDQNLPLVGALAKYVIPNVSEVFVLFDGLFLTAARYPRYLDVRNVLDQALETDKVFYCEERMPLTNHMDALDAVNILKALGPVKPLDVKGRAKYFSLLSDFTEEEYVKIYKDN